MAGCRFSVLTSLDRCYVAALIECRARWSFTIDAVVLLPDHMHTIWTLPTNDANYSRRWGWIKKEFTKGWLAAGQEELPVSSGRARKRYHGVFQPRFWEHMIRDEDDFIRHADYIHFNPVKHGYVRCAWDWEWSSFRSQVAKGWYFREWRRRRCRLVRSHCCTSRGIGRRSGRARQGCRSGCARRERVHVGHVLTDRMERVSGWSECRAQPDLLWLVELQHLFHALDELRVGRADGGDERASPRRRGQQRA